MYEKRLQNTSMDIYVAAHDDSPGDGRFISLRAWDIGRPRKSWLLFYEQAGSVPKLLVARQIDHAADSDRMWFISKRSHRDPWMNNIDCRVPRTPPASPESGV